MGSGKVLASVLAGAAAGAILGILFAPDKGTETRKKIRDAGSDFADNVKTKVSEYSDAIAEKYDSVREKITGLASEGRDMVNPGRGDKGMKAADVRNTMNT